jgi:prepilin-type processing-associated H-X9-DG protein
MVLALHLYENSNRCLPLQSGSTGYSPQARLLPFIEQSGVHDRIDYSIPAYLGSAQNTSPNPALSAIFPAIVPVFLCPADQGPKRFSVEIAGQPYSFGAINYMVSNGSGTGTNYDDRFPNDGVVQLNVAKRLAEISDGTSNTVFMSEAIRGGGQDLSLQPGTLPSSPYRVMSNATSGISPGTGPGYSGSGSGWPGGTVANPDLTAVVAAHTDWRGGGASGAARGLSWVRGLTNNVLTNGYLTPNSRIPDVQFHGSGLFGPRSFHPGGANVGFGDGSVQLLNSAMDQKVHWALHSCNGGEAIGPF